MNTILVTGAGSGFGAEIALRLADEGQDVIAAVEIPAQEHALATEAGKRGIRLRIEKLDVTNEGDRQKAARWDINVLLNNAGISEGGSVADIPAENLRRQYEVNIIGPVLLTQIVIRGMIQRGQGKVVFMSSVAGLTTDPFAGAYASSKHAIEAIAAALRQEMQEFGIEVATINPGPFLTGFNDRMFETWKGWRDEPDERVFDYSRIAFPHEQYDPEPVIQTAIGVLTGKIGTYRNVEPKEIIPQQRDMMDREWTRKSVEGIGKRAELVEKAYKLKPSTPV
ncbi:SDR family oxidoreductase [Acetobacter conturbans]|uniref:SDR family oxidoreductase n=1 Tax=Acetobacter conturbans TaxID=1737472 RepID=A0ABX0K2K3_9PROT|nr:SDR family oxidoreductase [Acetobacter conturbans]NHN89359.1 SDR family oxidoreductase [Acetobacter conturbans]